MLRSDPKILFVCTGNTCRSVLAEYLFKKLRPELSENVSSAGIHASPLLPIPESVTKLLNEEGIKDFKHEPRIITPKLAAWATRIFVMENYHKEYLLKNFPEAQSKVALLAQTDIKDPIGGTEEVYRNSLTEIKKALEELHVS